MLRYIRNRNETVNTNAQYGHQNILVSLTLINLGYLFYNRPKLVEFPILNIHNYSKELLFCSLRVPAGLLVSPLWLRGTDS